MIKNEAIVFLKETIYKIILYILYYLFEFILQNLYILVFLCFSLLVSQLPSYIFALVQTIQLLFYVFNLKALNSYMFSLICLISENGDAGRDAVFFS